MSLDETIRSSISRAGIVRVRNALNPLLWACAVVPGVSWAAAFAFRGDVLLRYFLTGLGSLPIFGLMVAYFIFLFKDPNRLQSEEFILRQQELSLIEHKGRAPAEVLVDAVDPDDLISTHAHDRLEREP